MIEDIFQLRNPPTYEVSELENALILKKTIESVPCSIPFLSRCPKKTVPPSRPLSTQAKPTPAPLHEPMRSSKPQRAGAIPRFATYLGSVAIQRSKYGEHIWTVG